MLCIHTSKRGNTQASCDRPCFLWLDQVKTGSIVKCLRAVVTEAEKHIKSCIVSANTFVFPPSFVPFAFSFSLYLNHFYPSFFHSPKVCEGKGFVCEFCQQSEIIFPFELQKVSSCPGKRGERESQRGERERNRDRQTDRQREGRE